MGTQILLVSGSTRSGSTNTAALRTAQAVASEDVTAVLYEGIADLPHFNPDDDRDPLPPAVADLRAQIESSDGVLFCAPEYAGGLPGSFKNLLDWLVGGMEIYGKPVAWMNVSGKGRGLNVEASLATVLGYVGAVIIEPACRHITVPRDAVGADGIVISPAIRHQVADAVRALSEHVRTAGQPPTT